MTMTSRGRKEGVGKKGAGCIIQCHKLLARVFASEFRLVSLKVKVVKTWLTTCPIPRIRYRRAGRQVGGRGGRRGAHVACVAERRLVGSLILKKAEAARWLFGATLVKSHARFVPVQYSYLVDRKLWLLWWVLVFSTVVNCLRAECRS